MHLYVISVIAERLALAGISQNRWLTDAQFSLSELTETQFLTAQQVNRLALSAIKLAGDTHFGVNVGMRLKMLSLGMFGYALMTSSSVGDVLNLLLRYNRALMPSIDIALVSTEAGIELRCKIGSLATDLESLYADLLYSSLYANLHILAPSCLHSVTLDLCYTAPDNATLHRSVFGDSVRFNATNYGMVFSRDSLAIGISSSNPVAQDIFRRHCDRILSNDVQTGIVSERVKRELMADRSNFPSSATIAERLHISESTLQRRLAREGNKFQPLLDQVRYRLALDYLEGTNLPVSEIATLLDFSSAANFRRAFKRWSGQTPSALRDSLRVQSPQLLPIDA